MLISKSVLLGFPIESFDDCGYKKKHERHTSVGGFDIYRKY